MVLKLGKYSVGVTIGSSGAGSLSAKVPGTFATLDKASPNFSGVEMIRASMFFGSGTMGDYVKRITLQDSDGVIGLQARAVFPAYPVIADSSSAFSTDSEKGGYLNPNRPMVFEPQGESSLIPSGLYIVIDVQKASAIADTFYASILWDDRS